jgi:hypothetical protein
MDPEIIVYLTKLKKYLSTNMEAREYFINDLDEEEFFIHVEDIAVKNFYEKGDPTLNMEQFELVKNTLKSKKIINREKEYYEPNIFIDKRGYCKILKT